MAKKTTGSDPSATQTDPNQSETGGATTVKAAPAPEAGKTLKVRIARTHPDLAYHAGEVVDLPQELFDRYQPDGPFFEEVTAKADSETDK